MRASRLLALLLAQVMVVMLCAGALPADSAIEDDVAGGGQQGLLPLTWEAKSSADWLRGKLEKPKSGHELPLLALLRSGQATGKDALVQTYVDALLEKLAEGTGDEKLNRLAWQAMVLAAAGVDVNARAPAIVEAFAEPETVSGAGAETVRLALLVFGPAGVQPPPTLDTAALARQLAGARNLDGGYGKEDVSDPASTARALQALAFYRNDGAVENGVMDGLDWLRRNQSDFGGFEIEGSPSAAATAEAAIALGCLGEERLDADTPPPAQAVLVFHNEDGAFLPDPGSKADVDLTALGLLALAGAIRLEEDRPPVYRFTDVEKAQAGLLGEGAAEVPITITGTPLSTPVLVAILAGTVALIVLLAALVSGGRDMRRRKKRRQRLEQLRDSGQLPPGVDIDDEDFELEFDYEYVGDELPPPDEDDDKNAAP